MMTGMVKEYVGFIAPVIVVPGEDEMRALYEGAKRVLDNVDKELVYEEEILI
jgi:butyrate kinase